VRNQTFTVGLFNDFYDSKEIMLSRTIFCTAPWVHFNKYFYRNYDHTQLEHRYCMLYQCFISYICVLVIQYVIISDKISVLETPKVQIKETTKAEACKIKSLTTLGKFQYYNIDALLINIKFLPTFIFYLYIFDYFEDFLNLANCHSVRTGFLLIIRKKFLNILTTEVRSWNVSSPGS
jgi:hypothetical protein